VDGSTDGTSFEDAVTEHVRALRGRLIAGALIALTLMVALALAFVWRQYEAAKRDAVAELRARAILAATVFDTYFSGQLGALSAVAASPAVMDGDTRAMTVYFAGFRPGGNRSFTAGVGWIDLDGQQRATSDPEGPLGTSVADRSYFKTVVATKKPFVAEAIVARKTQRRLIVMGVPTFDRDGRLTGVLAGGIILRPSTDNARATDLGYEGLQVIDRQGQQVTSRDLASPPNQGLLAALEADKEGDFVNTSGLDGSDGRVVAFATSAVAGWKTVLDQPTSTVFGDARRTLVLEVLLVTAAALASLALIGWAVRRARRDIRRARAQVGRWAQLTRSLNAAVDEEAVRETLATALASEFPHALVVTTVDQPRSNDPSPPTIVRGRRSQLDGVSDDIAQSITGLVIEQATPIALATRADARQAGIVAAAAGSIYGAPLSDRESPRGGAVALLFARERALGSHDFPLVQAHADQARQALDRVRRHQEEHDVAVLLQQSLLPGKLPEADGVQIGAYYRAGALNTKVGGDWYDVVRRPDGILHLTVGDVAGRGIEAAVLMGQLRNAFRAYALEHVSPAAIILRLANHVGEDGMATVVCVTYDPYTRALLYASAGHMPPLVIDPDPDTVVRLEQTATGPLGWRLPSEALDTEAIVPAGAFLALYTDGLVERRGDDLDENINRLGATIASVLPAEPTEPTDVVEAVVNTVRPYGDDDLALLLARLGAVPSAVRIELPAEPPRLRGLRRRVGTWLALRGVEEAARNDAVLALSEACNNAIEHGYRDTHGTIRISLDHTPDTLTVRVQDDGNWREPEDDTTRGRGMMIIQSIMSETQILQTPNGTEVILQQRLNQPDTDLHLVGGPTPPDLHRG
jgi:anti-sigma regulatory factor (Ser/Thr protein kinase)